MLPNSTPHADARASAVFCKARRARAGERGHLSASQAERVLFEKLAQLLRKQIDPPLDQPLTALSLQVPPYPDEVRRANITGVVRIQFKVEPNGSVSGPAIVGAPPPILA